MKKLQRTVLIAAALFAAGAARAADQDAMAPDARAELAAAIDLLKAHHMNRASVDWPTVEAQAWRDAKDAKTAADTYPAIRGVIAQLHEKHTVLQPAAFVKATMANKPEGPAARQFARPPESLLLAGGIGLLHIPAHSTNKANDAIYANALRALVLRLRAAHVCHFIVDLRGNSGGNMYPMILGLDALLGAEPYGFWDYGSGPLAPWIDPDGTYDEPTARPDLSRTPVAVLLNDGTVSAGEFTAMAFEGRADTRFFGEPTAGYVSANAPYYLPDGAMLGISEGYGADRMKRPYRVAIVPDEQTDPGQPTLDAAIGWLKKQRCR